MPVVIVMQNGLSNEAELAVTAIEIEEVADLIAFFMSGVERSVVGEPGCQFQLHAVQQPQVGYELESTLKQVAGF